MDFDVLRHRSARSCSDVHELLGDSRCHAALYHFDKLQSRRRRLGKGEITFPFVAENPGGRMWNRSRRSVEGDSGWNDRLRYGRR